MWVEIGDASLKKIRLRLFLLLVRRSLRRYQGCNACMAAMLASESSVKLARVLGETTIRSRLSKIKARFKRHNCQKVKCGCSCQRRGEITCKKAKGKADKDPFFFMRKSSSHAGCRAAASNAWQEIQPAIIRSAKWESIGLCMTFVWIPAHIGIQGNEIADKCAKEATKTPLLKWKCGPHFSLSWKKGGRGSVKKRQQEGGCTKFKEK